MEKILGFKKMIRPLDVVLVAVLMALSFVPIAVFAHYQSNTPPGSQLVAVININGIDVDTFPLEAGGPNFTVIYDVHDGLRGTQYNIIEVDGDRVRVKEDNSPDQIAVNTGWISRRGQTSICLPHRLMIRIDAVNPVQNDDEEIIILG